MITPRDYQLEALNSVISSWREGITRQLVSLPTGCGKTIIFGLVAETLRLPTLIIAHREELLYQAEQKLKLIYPEADIGILKAGERGGLESKICIASVQTATRHTEELSKRDFKLLICDEAHHAVTNSYTKIFNDLGFMYNQPDKLLLGVTATAYRGDNAGLDAVFEKIIFERSILTMIKAGYLSDVRGLEVSTDCDISDVTMTAGDFSVNKLSAIIDTPQRNELIVNSYLELGEERRGIAFCVKFDHALHLAEAFRKRGISCEAVYGDMESEERQDVLNRFANHELQLLTNVGVLTEGWDAPDLSLILMARPTKSKGLFIQCVGRGLRIAPDKVDCLLIDFVDTARNHKLCSLATLAGKEYIKPNKHSLLKAVEDEALESAQFIAADLGTPTISTLDLFDRSTFVWQKTGANYILSLVDNRCLVCQAVNGGYRPLFISSPTDVKTLVEGVLPLDYACGVCEDYARTLDSARFSLKNASWRNAPATEAQFDYLRKLKVSFDRDITKGEASDLITQAKAELNKWRFAI